MKPAVVLAIALVVAPLAVAVVGTPAQAPPATEPDARLRDAFALAAAVRGAPLDPLALSASPDLHVVAHAWVEDLGLGLTSDEDAALHRDLRRVPADLATEAAMVLGTAGVAARHVVGSAGPDAAGAAFADVLEARLPALRAAAAAAPLAEPLVVDLPWFTLLVVGTAANDYHPLAPALVIEPGGDDYYDNRVGSTGFFDVAGFRLMMPASIAVDLGGNDVYSTAPAAAFRGLAVTYDATGNDEYRGGGLASARSGAALLFDGAGDDSYACGERCQGFGYGGTAVLWDAAGNDRYVAAYASQGVGSSSGTGILLDVAGSDRYECYYCQGMSEFSQGAGIMLDLAGDDTYATWGVARGGAIYEGRGLVGFFLDGEGLDAYLSAPGADGTEWGPGVTGSGICETVCVGTVAFLKGADCSPAAVLDGCPPGRLGLAAVAAGDATASFCTGAGTHIYHVRTVVGVALCAPAAAASVAGDAAGIAAASVLGSGTSASACFYERFDNGMYSTQVEMDVCAPGSASSVLGDASSPYRCHPVVWVRGLYHHRNDVCQHGVAASGTGSADGAVAVSAAGPASGTVVAASALGDTATSDNCVGVGFVVGVLACPVEVAASGTGSARGAGLGVSAVGNASSVAGPNGGVRCAVVVAATACFQGAAAAPLGSAEGGSVAASVLGAASAAETPDCVRAVIVAGCVSGLAASGAGPARGPASVSGTGDSEAYGCWAYLPSCQRGVAVSGTGRASGGALAVSGCSLAGACLDPV